MNLTHRGRQGLTFPQEHAASFASVLAHHQVDHWWSMTVAAAAAKQELESARRKVSIASPEKSTAPAVKPSPAKSLQSVNSEGELSDFAKKLKAKAEAKAKEKQTKKEKTLNAAERAQAMTALLKSELDEVGKAAKSEHALSRIGFTKM